MSDATRRDCERHGDRPEWAALALLELYRLALTKALLDVEDVGAPVVIDGRAFVEHDAWLAQQREKFRELAYAMRARVALGERLPVPHRLICPFCRCPLSDRAAGCTKCQKTDMDRAALAEAPGGAEG